MFIHDLEVHIIVVALVHMAELRECTTYVFLLMEI